MTTATLPLKGKTVAKAESSKGFSTGFFAFLNNLAVYRSEQILNSFDDQKLNMLGIKRNEISDHVRKA